MAKQGYKLQEFVAHASDVNCLNIGKKSCRVFVTGGEDRKVNLWAIDKPTALLSLCGHTSSVQSVTFDSAETLVLAGSSNGTIKLWDLEEAKIVRSIAGHRFNCTSVEFHPFGEFFASGSLDTDLKIWDIRKKGCIHTYKGHARGIRTIRFTPDGRWVVTGGDDNVVKLWDLTAGKLLHDFKVHNGMIRCIDFHPQEFLLATGSADRTVKFWDLETFELIGSAGPEATGVRSIVFNPDGRTLFCGLDETLKVLSWEPIRYHDDLDMGWSTLGDLSIYEGKLLGCSYHQSRVGVWVADISLIGPYAAGAMPKKNSLIESTYNHVETHSVGLTGSCINSCPTLITSLPDRGEESKQSVIEMIKPIDPSNAVSINSSEFKTSRVHVSCNSTSEKFNLKSSPKVPTKNSTTFRVGKASEISSTSPVSTESSYVSREVPPKSRVFRTDSSSSLKKCPSVEFDKLSNNRAMGRSVSTPFIIPRDNLAQESVASSRKGTVTTETVSRASVFCKLNDTQKALFAGDGSDCVAPTRPLTAPTSRSLSGTDGLQGMGSNLLSKLMNGESVTSDEVNSTSIRNVTKSFERIMSPEQSVLHNDRDAGQPCSSNETSCIKYVKGVAIQLGRTRSLVERWEKGEKCNSSRADTVSSSDHVSTLDNLPTLSKGEVYATDKATTAADSDFVCETLLGSHDVFINAVKSRLTKLQVVRHFWRTSGIKGAIDAVAKLPDHSVQVDVISVLIEKIDLFTLDLFSCLLPLLAGLLNSKIERHLSLSLEMLLELVKIFGPVIHLTISATPSVGVDLQAEQRSERCKQCYNHLEKIRQMLPMLVRSGGIVARHAQKLNLVLNAS